MRTRNPAAKKEQLLLAALDEFATYGVAGARVDRLAKRAGISPGLVYSFYEGKEQLFDAVFERIAELAMSTVPINADDLPEYAARLYDAGLQHPEVGRFMTWYQLDGRDGTVPDVVEASMKEKIAAIKEAQQHGTVTAAMPAGQILALVLTIANMWSQSSENLLALVPKTRRRKTIYDAVACLVTPRPPR